MELRLKELRLGGLQCREIKVGIGRDKRKEN
jgi:hypothetical protein